MRRPSMLATTINLGATQHIDWRRGLQVIDALGEGPGLLKVMSAVHRMIYSAVSFPALRSGGRYLM